MVWFCGETIRSPNMPGTSTGVRGSLPSPFLIAKGDSPLTAIGADVAPSETISRRRSRDDDHVRRRDDPEWFVYSTAIGRFSTWPFPG